MNKQILLVFILSIFIIVTLQAQSTDKYQGMIELITEAYNSKEYKKISDQFAPAMLQAISEADFSNFLASVQSQLGQIQKTEYSRKKSGFQIYQTTFERGSIWEIWFALDPSDKISGFQIIPAGTASKSINVMEFIKNNPERAAIKLTINEEIVLAQNPTQKMPLASTVKIMVAIEYAHQVASGKISSQEQVKINDLEVYYIPNTDGGAHAAWKRELEKEQKVVNDAVNMEDVAKGMISFSSNANTEYLMDRLGLSNINQNISKLGLKNHDPLYYMVSSLFAYRNEKNEATSQHLTNIQQLSKLEIAKKAEKIHQELKKDYKHLFRKEEYLKHLNMEVQKVWSDNLTASTVEDYVSIMEKINSKTYFSPEVQKNIEIILESSAMKAPRLKEMMLNCGYKGGSTAFVLTTALYATTKEGKKIVFAYFFNNLTPEEQQQLQSNAGNFDLELLRK
jgi:D-alanyl-D-alanine carboxypeptidase